MRRHPAAPPLLALALVLLLAPLIPSPARAGLPPTDGSGHALPTLAPMLERLTPAVVNIATRSTVTERQSPLQQDPMFRWFFEVPRAPRQRETQSLGSGVVVDAKRGYILTNHHVVDNADQIEVTLTDGRTLQADLVGSDAETDVAVIKVPAENLTEAPMADSDNVRVGDFVVAIGNPFGLGQTVTSGIVSALGRSGLGIEGYEDFIQTDASINPGNSGGALVDLGGHLVGINTAIVSPQGGNVGIGFAIPVNMAKDVMTQLIAYGEVRRGQLGVVIQDVTPAMARALDLNVTEGAIVPQVMEGSAAEKAGIRKGDVIVAVDGKPVKGASDLRNHVGLLRAGEKVRLDLIRDGKRRTVTATIGERQVTQLAGKDVSPRLAGAVFGDLPGKGGQQAGVAVSGVDRGSPAWSAGLRPGDVIVQVNRHDVAGVGDLKSMAGHLGDTLLLNVERDGQAFFILIQ
jgi:Do/DeqQ family serine protease